MTNDALLHLVYKAALDGSLWPEVLAAFSTKFGCAAAVLYDRNIVNDERSIGLNASLGYSDQAHADFAAYFRYRDIHVRRTLPAAVTGHVYLDDRDIAFAELEATEIQTDFYRRNGVGHVGGIILAKRSTQFSVLSVHRSLRFGPFTTDEVALLDQIAPHLVRAWEITGTLRRASDDTRALLGALGALGATVFVVDATGTVSRMSPEAEQLARAGDYLRIRYNKLVAVNVADDAQLKKLLVRAVARPMLGTPPDPATLALRNSAGVTALTLFLTSSFSGAFSGEPHVLVFANDPRASRPSNPALIGQQFGLSRAETQVVVAISKGLSVREMADRFCVSSETIRTHLKHAMAKCEVRSQVDLVRLALGSLGALGRD